MSGETPYPGHIEFIAKRDGNDTRHAIDIVYDDSFETIEARLFWFNASTNAWARNFPIVTRQLCVPSAVIQRGGPEAMCQFLVDFYNGVLDALFGSVTTTSPFPPHADPDGIVNATRNLLMQYRVEVVGGKLRLVK